MKLILFLFLPIYGVGQVPKDAPTSPVISMRCAVAHSDGRGNIFTCDYNGIYYPEYIADDKIKKWFVKMNGHDSLFYFRHDVTHIFKWIKESKKELYGYECKKIGTIIPDPYRGDTIHIKEQYWRPK